MKRKLASELTLKDKIYLLRKGSHELVVLDIASIKNRPDRQIEVACGLQGIHKPTFSYDPGLVFSFEASGTDLHDYYYSDKLAALTNLKTQLEIIHKRLFSEQASIIVKLENLEKEINHEQKNP